ncbi:MAG: ergothioneine biosynthesis protein EgtB, partial [Burkholderiales bacterium]|nr:ergothioneine biosynthesis protein EgtB [Burkholderiales bacterium]
MNSAIPNTTTAKITERSVLAARFAQVRATTEKLTAPLSNEDVSLQSMPDASPTKWHLAHTSWFFETFILERFDVNFKPFNQAFRVLFNSYYNAVGDKHPRPERGLISRPDFNEVLAYRQHVTARIAELIPRLETSTPDFAALMWLGCHHEEQHQELVLTDLKHLLSKNPLKPAYQQRWPLTPIQGRKPRWIDYRGGLISIGRDDDTAEFGFDNESPRHQVFLLPFELASYPVTHGDFATFIADGGYTQPALWLSMGWDWVQANRIEAPLYWQMRDSDWHTFTLHGMAPIDAHTPICHINYFEADAFARWASTQAKWKGARLPRETEWEHAAALTEIAGNFLESDALHPLALREEKPSSYPAQLFGDVWEWTQSAYLPYPRYRAVEGAVGEYNGKFMCNQFVLRGGSCATPRQHIRPTYRN